MNTFLFNFITWYYLVAGVDLWRFTARRFVFMLHFTNTLPMLQNITVPMFQDQTGIGKVVSVMIRFCWVWMGGLFSIIAIVPLLVSAVVFYLLIPLAVWMIILNLQAL